MQHTIFHDIVSGKIPSYTVYENTDFLAFLDIFPRTKGHTLVIPKTPYEWVYDVPQFGAYWETVLKVTRGIQQALEPSFVSYATHGLEIRYAHIHILPRYGELDAAKHNVFPKEVIKMEKTEFEDLAEQIRRAL
jgi:histidine triad (HIT) family protein